MVLLAQQVLVGRSWCGRSPWAEPPLAAAGARRKGLRASASRAAPRLQASLLHGHKARGEGTARDPGKPRWTGRPVGRTRWGRRGGSAATIRVRAGAGEEGRAGKPRRVRKQIDFGQTFNFDGASLCPITLDHDRWVQ